MTQASNQMELQSTLSRPGTLHEIICNMIPPERAKKIYRLEFVTNDDSLIDNVVIFLRLDGSDGPCFREIYVEVPEFDPKFNVSSLIQRILTKVDQSIKAVEE